MCAVGVGVGSTSEDLPGETRLVFINELMRKANPDLEVKCVIGGQARIGFSITLPTVCCALSPPS